MASALYYRATEWKSISPSYLWHLCDITYSSLPKNTYTRKRVAQPLFARKVGGKEGKTPRGAWKAHTTDAIRNIRCGGQNGVAQVKTSWTLEKKGLGDNAAERKAGQATSVLPLGRLSIIDGELARLVYPFLCFPFFVYSPLLRRTRCGDFRCHEWWTEEDKFRGNWKMFPCGKVRLRAGYRRDGGDSGFSLKKVLLWSIFIYFKKFFL